MPTRLKGRRASSQLGFANGKVWSIKEIFSGIPILGQRHRVPGGLVIAKKINQLGNALIDIPDPYLVFIQLDDEANTLPRYVGRAAELFENAIGQNHSSQAAGVPLNCYAAPHHLGGGFWSNPLYDANPVIVEDTRLEKSVLTLNAGIEIHSKHPITRYVPYASNVLTTFDAPAQPYVGVCPLGEREAGVYEFIFHIGRPSADPIAIKTDTDHMDAGEGTIIALPAAPGAQAYSLFTSHWCPIGRGIAAYLQVFSSADFVPRVVYLTDFAASLLTQSLLDIDPGYQPDEAVEDTPLPPHTSSFANIGENNIVFMYHCSKLEETRLFLSVDGGGAWGALNPPLTLAQWTGHIPVGFLVGGPSLLTPFGEGCVMFATLKSGEDTLFVWYTLDSGASWAGMNMGGFDFAAVVPAAGPTVIRPYVDEDDQGEFVMLVRNTETNAVDIYATTDLGAHWGYRGPADFPPSVVDPQGFNQHLAYVGTYDSPAPILAGRPGLMELA